MIFTDILVLLAAYVIGSFPTAWLAGKVFGGKDYDIREHGSGNVGAANATRNLGWKAGIITFLFDFFKGFAVIFWLPALISAQSMGFETARVLLSVLVLIGHSYPVFIRFRGGKGVATTAGIIMAFRWEVGLVCMAVFIIAVLISRQSGIGSICATIFFPLSNLFMLYVLDIPISPQMLWFSIALPFFILFTHRENIRKILQGTNQKDF
ncbi:MAG: glycerol-3-phosphate 1-O-acyltransferase PlsY [Candidatus Marinimicrobia bacterium]|nr:glycerol-3-phosphate 1-O-acyltransferase PlsY [Candidatus Neomarinimicrobiota bacterium]